MKSESILTLITYIPEWLAEILNESDASKIVVSSNPEVVEAERTYKLEKDFKICHGLIVFDETKVIFIFSNDSKICIMSEGFGVVQFSKMLIDSLIA